MSAQPTTAPWIIDADNNLIHAADDRHTVVCSFATTLRNRDVMADARLIAAAPMLLDELRMCEAHLHAFVEAIESGGGSASQSAERLAAVRDAIAKATGAAQ